MGAGRGASVISQYNRHNQSKFEGYRYEIAFQEAWAGLRFDRSHLLTQDCQPLRILHPGTHNFDQGPDFLHADIQIGSHRHHGHVELHLDSDDWQRHGHHRDPQYDAVVLHVFLQAGKRVAQRSDGSVIPGLWLGDRIGKPQAVRGSAALPCSGLGRHFLPADPQAWLEQAGMVRLQEKAEAMHGALIQGGGDWAQLLWEELAAALGGPVNAQYFRELARQMPWALARKYQYARQSIEALLFGICGMLEGRAADAYHGGLQETWGFLRYKHGLAPRPIPFKFHRMHPAGFPTIRIAQLAALAHRHQPLYQLLEIEGMRSFVHDDCEGLSDYWAHRYEFGNTLNARRSELGMDARGRIVANVLAPLGVLYQAVHHGHGSDSAYLGLLRSVPAEQNKVTRKFAPIGLKPANALQSQGLIAIYRDKCSVYHCLDCQIGSKVLLQQAATRLDTGNGGHCRAKV
jgi:hypothetical protein